MPGQPLEPSVRAFMAERFGQHFEDVRVHTDPQAAESAEAEGAKAYTVGNHIAFQQGEYAPDTSAGRKSIAHELAHVVQQSRGGGSAPGHDADHPLEHGAERAADQVASAGGPVQVSGASAPGLARQPDTELERLRQRAAEIDGKLSAEQSWDPDEQAKLVREQGEIAKRLREAEHGTTTVPRPPARGASPAELFEHAKKIGMVKDADTTDVPEPAGGNAHTTPRGLSPSLRPPKSTYFTMDGQVWDTRDFEPSSEMGMSEAMQYAWEHGSTADKVEMTATGVGVVGGFVPYAGDYVSLGASAVTFGAKPSWSSAADVGLDAVGAALPFVPAMGTVRRMERLLEKANDTKRIAQVAEELKRTAKAAEAAKKTATKEREAKRLAAIAEEANRLRKVAEERRAAMKAQEVARKRAEFERAAMLKERARMNKAGETLPDVATPRHPSASMGRITATNPKEAAAAWNAGAYAKAGHTPSRAGGLFHAELGAAGPREGVDYITSGTVKDIKSHYVWGASTNPKRGIDPDLFARSVAEADKQTLVAQMLLQQAARRAGREPLAKIRIQGHYFIDPVTGKSVKLTF